MDSDFTIYCITITRGTDSVWVSDFGRRGHRIQGTHPAEIVQTLVELGGEFLTASYAAGLTAFKGHEEHHVVWIRMPKSVTDVSMLN